jgi:hypothetical protein
MCQISNQITICSRFFKNLDFIKITKLEFVDISSKIECFYHLQIDDLHHQISISFFYDKYKFNIARFCEFWQFSLVPTHDFWPFFKMCQNMSKYPRNFSKHLDINVLDHFSQILKIEKYEY